EAQILNLSVVPDARRQGLGRALLERFIDDAQRSGAEQMFLEVRVSNAPAIALYEKYGFHIIGLRKRYYQPSGADAFTMRRPAVTGFPHPGAEHSSDSEVVS
ncbi:MAG: ribosomal protein S18-alanine N-acetyltransferase, partial [Stackebrandtia sp.]